MWNKVLNKVGGIVGIVGFFLMLGGVGSNDYMVEIGEYAPWYYGWQYLLAGLLLMGLSSLILSHTETEDYDDDFE
jgi:hypothetical protein